MEKFSGREGILSKIFVLQLLKNRAVSIKEAISLSPMIFLFFSFSRAIEDRISNLESREVEGHREPD